MAGLTQARQQVVLDTEFAAGDYIAWSANGTSETASLARTAVVAWTSASAATPSVKQNSGALTSAAASADVLVTHWAVFSAASAGIQRIDWTPLTESKDLDAGDQITLAAGAFKVTID